MRQYTNISITYIIAIISFIIIYYYSFKTPIYREPYFYFFDKTILISPEKESILKKIQIVQEISSDQLSIQIDDRIYIIQKNQYYFNNFIKLFYITILISFFSLLFAVWFLEFSRDIYFFTFFILNSILIYISLLFVYYKIELLYDIFLFFLFWLTFSFINLQIRFIGKHINTFVLLIEAILLVFLFISLLILDSTTIKDQILNLLVYYILTSIFLISLSINIIRIFNKKIDIIDKQKILSFILGNIIGFSNIILLLKFKEVNNFIYLFNALIYPLLIAYSIYRMYLVPNQLIITNTLVNGFLTILFIGIYFISIYFYSILYPDYLEKYKIFYDISFLIILSLFIEPLRQKFIRFINIKFLIPDKNYILSLMRLSKILSRISRPNLAIEQFLSEVKKILGLKECYLLLPKNYVLNIELSPNIVKELDSKEEIWKYIKPEKIIATTYIIYSTGLKKRLFHYLYENQILLLIGLGQKEFLLQYLYLYFLKLINTIYKIFYKKDFDIYKKNIENILPKTALLVGYPQNRNKFYIQEIRYLQEVARLATILIHNIYILFREVDKRKKIRYILQSGKFQKKLSFHIENFPEGIQIQYFNQPVLSVSGDYIDILPISKSKIGVFLGDVSGHGLGTGYLVSAIRSIVRYAVENQFSLKEIVNLLNLFLTDRYKGYEFLTLFSFILDISTGEMEFINAAHPGIFIKTANKPLYKIEKTQRLLGISEANYESYFIQIEPETKLFLFSDGVLETTNPNNELYGEKRFIEFLNKHSSLSINEITKSLINELKNFRQSQEFQDDTTFLVIEYNPKKNLLELFLKAIGLKI